MKLYKFFLFQFLLEVTRSQILTEPTIPSKYGDVILERTGGLEEFPERAVEFIRQKEDIVLTVAEQARKAYLERIELMINCSCMAHECSNVASDDAVCGFDLGSSDACGQCEGFRYMQDRGIVTAKLADQSPLNLSSGLKASVCLMQSLETIIPSLKEQEAFTWTYLGLETGALWKYPGVLASRDACQGFPQWNYCTQYDPRSRPWYHEGATGPLDLILIVDKSKLMGDVLDFQVQNDNGANVTVETTRWKIIQKSILKYIDTVTFSDYFNVIFFDDQSTIMGKEEPLLQGVEVNRKLLKDGLEEYKPSGEADFLGALQTAFDLFGEAALSQNGTSGCKKVIMFLSQGVDTKNNTIDQILEEVDFMQQELQQISGQQAFIFTYSIGENAEEDILRAMACAHNGSWTRINSQDDPMNSLNSYVRHIAAARQPRFVWSETYQDAYGLGEMITVTLPVYTPQNDFEVDGALFGVAAHDILLEDLEALAGQKTQDLIEALQQNSLVCDNYVIKQCQQQVFRGQASQCPELMQIQDCTSQEGLQSLTFFETVDASNLNSSDLFCDDDFENPELVDFSELVCCDKCNFEDQVVEGECIARG